MPKILIMLGIVALVGYWLTKPETKPASWQPMVDSCVSANTGSYEQCACLTDGLHQRLTEKELAAMLSGQDLGKAFQNHVGEAVRDISSQCR